MHKVQDLGQGLQPHEGSIGGCVGVRVVEGGRVGGTLGGGGGGVEESDLNLLLVIILRMFFSILYDTNKEDLLNRDLV